MTPGGDLSGIAASIEVLDLQAEEGLRRRVGYSSVRLTSGQFEVTLLLNIYQRDDHSFGVSSPSFRKNGIFLPAAYVSGGWWPAIAAAVLAAWESR